MYIVYVTLYDSQLISLLFFSRGHSVFHLLVNSTKWVSKFLMVVFSVSNLGGTDSNPHWTIIVIGKGRLMHVVNFKYTHNVHTIMYTLGQTLVILPARFTCFILFYLLFNLIE